jgi:hypothetical protein
MNQKLSQDMMEAAFLLQMFFKNDPAAQQVAGFLAQAAPVVGLGQGSVGPITLGSSEATITLQPKG